MRHILKTTACLLACALPASAGDWNVDIFAGSASSPDLHFVDGDYATNSDTAWGIGISKSDVFMPGLDLGVEYSSSGVEYTGFEPNNIRGDALMLTADYGFYRSGSFEVYGTLGLGVIDVEYTSISGAVYSNSDTVAGGTIGIGGIWDVSDSVGIFAEVRHTRALSDPQIAFADASRTAEFATNSVLAGVRISF